MRESSELSDALSFHSLLGMTSLIAEARFASRSLQSGEKDRRPLANVPIVRVWISEVYADGSEARVDEK